MPTPPNGSATSLARPKPTEQQRDDQQHDERDAAHAAPSAGAGRRGEQAHEPQQEAAGGELGGAWPSRSTACLRSSGRRSASASDASAMRRSAMRSCGRAAAIARWKCLRAVSAS